MTKTGRNDPCPCGSGKKFKKCCEKNMIKGKFLAQKMQTGQGKNLAGFFQQNVATQTPFTLKGRTITTATGNISNPKQPLEQPPEQVKEDLPPEEKKEEENS